MSFPMKRRSILLIGLTVCLSFSSCIQRKMTVSTQQLSGNQMPWSTIMQRHLKSANAVVLHSADKTYELFNVMSGDTAFAAVLTPTRKEYRYIQWKNYGRLDIPWEDRPYVRGTVHLFTYQKYEDVTANIPYTDILEMRQVRNNVLLNTAINSGMTVGAFGIFLAIVCNCPRVYLEDGGGTLTYSGSILTGAFSRALERTDQIILGKTADSDIKLRFMNELAEDEYIDQLRLVKMRKKPGFHLTYHIDGGIHSVRELQRPLKAFDHSYRDRMALVEESDSFKFSFNTIADPEKLNHLDLLFSTEQISASAGLVIEARQTEWMTAMAEVFFHALGDHSTDWFDHMDQADPKRYALHAEQRGISMTVQIETPQGWVQIGSIHNAGTGEYKRFFVPLKPEVLANLIPEHDGVIRIRLQSAYNFWEVNQVAMALESGPVEEIAHLPWSEAITLNGENVLDQLKAKDNRYLELIGQGTGIQLGATGNTSDDEFLVLEATGYYRHQDMYSGKADLKAIRFMKPVKGTQRLSVKAATGFVAQ